MNNLRPDIADLIIKRVGSSGQPPQYGVQYFTAGLDWYLDVLNQEYMRTYLRGIGSDFKLVVGVYGSGKTHFLYTLRDLAWRNNFAVSYVTLSHKESPFHKLDLVYKAIIKGLVPSLPPEDLLNGAEPGIATFLRFWYSQRLQVHRQAGLRGEDFRDAMLSDVKMLSGITVISFERAVKAAFQALLDENDEAFENICAWLQGESYRSTLHNRYGITTPINERNAFSMIKSLGQWVRQIGHAGLVILLDEAEHIGGLGTRQTEQLLSNLRELIDACGQTAFQGTLICYAVPDINFLEGSGPNYEALRQRLSTVFTNTNPTGVQVVLDLPLDEEDAMNFLSEVGRKLMGIYETAYAIELDRIQVAVMVDMIAHAAYKQRFSDQGYKRMFLQKLVEGLNFVRVNKLYPSAQDLKLV